MPSEPEERNLDYTPFYNLGNGPALNFDGSCRLSALDLAANLGGHINADDVLKSAQKFYEFLKPATKDS